MRPWTALVAFAVLLVLLVVPHGFALPLAAAPAQQAAGPLDTPLLAANMCGAGDAGDVHFTLAATGDTFPHENIQAAAEANGYDYLFDYLRPYLQAADMAYTNFDGAMLEGSPTSGYPLFNFSPRLAESLARAGVKLVSTANNHILDRGPEGLDATLAVLARNGIVQHGTVPSAEAAGPRPPYLPLTFTRGDATIRIGFISATWGTNGIPDPFGQVNLLWQGNSYGGQGGVRQSVLDAVAQADRETDLVVVAAHWGEEYQFYPQPYQEEGARRLAEAGADVILGAQPHTLQPVDIIDTGGRKTLVAYSLANFLASQGAFQSQYYTATSVIFYVGLVREAGGAVRVTGYRYLPTLHVDGDTRPAPLPADQTGVLAHVRRIMRDVDGARQVPAIPPAPGERVEVCPPVAFAETPGIVLNGDFAQHYATLGSGTTPREPRETIAVLGLPLGSPARGLSADCSRETTVLITERQRLEWDPQAAWPYRVLGAQLGAEAFRRRYGEAPQPRTDLPAAFGDERFRAFFERYGGLPVFGYPVSPALSEPGDGQPITVQYFERARLELVPGAASGDLLDQVRVADLGRQALEEGWICAAGTAQGQEPAAAEPGDPRAESQFVPASREAEAGSIRAPATGTTDQARGPSIALQERRTPFFSPLLILGAALGGLALVALLARESYQRTARYRRRRARRRPRTDDDVLLERLLEE
jgi:hypothetical protein